MNKSICDAPECTEKAIAKGVCGKHYMRLKRHGSYDLPEFVPQRNVVEKKHLTQEMLMNRIHYDPETGIFTWVKGIKAGDVAGSLRNTHCGPRWKIKLYHKYYEAHRLAYLYMTGAWPPEFVDHRDCNALNNKWENLRAATRAQNQRNCRRLKPNKSGVRGVRKRDWNSYEATVGHNGGTVYIGSFRTIEEARAAREAKTIELHGEFARLD